VEQELKLLSRLDHPNIMKVLDAFEDENKIYFITDDLKGQTLFNRIIYEGELGEETAASIAAFMVSIVKYLHKN